ncbi:collagen binding domain-containing protein [Schaalia sp. Marseille-Q2122]|uniref:MSCRAMM family protein n=1 Tax=Schaalia sp. Marseille-Q2122 TaxID=2736604 RepID=UPI00158D4C41|nr:SpaA isopeptide-forming pilin-related protein [Schaalia sp. Marseille-Q2122]
MRILTNDADPDGEQPSEFWSGQPFTTTAQFDASATTGRLLDARIRLMIEKSPVLSVQRIPDSQFAQRSESCDTDTHWCKDYYIAAVTGATNFSIPVPLSYLNRQTPPGTQTTVTWELFEGDNTQPLRSESRTFKAKVATEFTPFNYCAEGQRGRAAAQVSCEVPFETDNAASATHTPAQPIFHHYAVSAKESLDGGRQDGWGEYAPQRMKIVTKLPAGATYVAGWWGAQDRQWVYDPGTHTVTYEGPLHRENWHPCGGQTYCEGIKLSFENAEIYSDVAAKTPREYVLKSTITLDPGTAFEKILPEVTSTTTFKPQQKAAFPGKTSSDQMDKHQTSQNLTSDGGILYRGNTPLNFDDPNTDIMLWRLWVGNSNNGSEIAPKARGGITSNFTTFTDTELDPRLYFHRFTPPRSGDFGKRGNGTVEPRELEARFNALTVSLHGLTEDGQEELLAADMNSNDPAIFINDKARKYSGLKVRFSAPFVQDNSWTYFNISAAPLESEMAKWANGTYTQAQQYQNWVTAEGIKGDDQNTPFTLAVRAETDSNNNTITIKPIEPKIFMWIGDDRQSQINWDTQHNGERAFTYEKCEKKGDISTLYPPYLWKPEQDRTPVELSCARLGEYAVSSNAQGTWGQSTLPMKDVQHVVLLPAGIEYVRTVQTQIDGVIQPQPIEPRIVANYRNSGKTALIYNYGNIAHHTNVGGHERVTRSVFHLDTTINAKAAPETNIVEYYTVWSNNDVVKPNSNHHLDNLDLDGDGDTAEHFMRMTLPLKMHPPLELIARKSVSLDKSNWFVNAPAQDLGGDVYYRFEVDNRSFAETRSLYMIDVLPQANDHKIVEDVRGRYLPRTWARHSADGSTEHVNHSAFETPLAEALETVPENAEIIKRWDIFYALEPQGADTDSAINAQWKTANDITDWSAVRSIKLALKPGQSLGRHAHIEVVTHNRVPDTEQTRALPAGSRAVNSFATSTQANTGYIETNDVTVEAARYRVEGTVFADLDGNSTLSDGTADLKLSGLKVVLYDAGSGAKVAETTTNDGRYSFDLFKRGNYRVFFEKSAGSSVVPAGEGQTASHGAKCAVGSTEHAQATQETCAGGQAAAVNAVWTEDFAVTPDNATVVRNLGIRAVSRDVTIKKVDQAGAPLADVEFSLEWAAPLPGMLAPTPTPATQTASSNTEGIATFPAVPYGTYRLRETTTPAGYMPLAAPVTVTVTATPPTGPTGEVTPDATVTNELIKATVKVVKVDAASPTTKLPGAVFELRVGTQVKYTSTASDNQGIATFSDVVAGTYTLAEKTAPTGYVLATDTREVTVGAAQHGTVIESSAFPNTKISASVSFKKVDAETGAGVDGAVFGLFAEGVAGNSAADAAYQATSANGGVVQFADVAYGRYTLREITAPAGYAPTTAEQAVTVDDGDALTLADVTNAPIRGTVVAKKVEATTGVPVAGASFGLFAKQGDGSFAQASTQIALSDATGMVRFAGVPVGTYQLRETAAPATHVLNTSDAREVTIATQGQSIDLTAQPFENVKVTGQVTVKKVEAGTDTPIPGTRFAVFTKAGAQVGADKATDAQGLVSFDLPFGEYVVKETAPALGFNPAAQAEGRPFQISTHGQKVDLTGADERFTNTPITGSVAVTKVDAEDANVTLVGVEFGLYPVNEAGVVGVVPAYVAVSGPGGVALFEGVRFGSYQLKERKGLTAYIPSSTAKDVVISTQGQRVELGNFPNQVKKGSVTLRKVDADEPTKGVPGAVFQLKQGNTVAYEQTSGANGAVVFTGVKHGDYTLVEASAPESYVLDAAWAQAVSITEQGQTLAVGDVTNRLKKATVSAVKWSTDDDAPLAGAVFALKQGQDTVSTATSGTDGALTFSNVPYGDYTLVETTAPAGFVLDPTERAVQVRVDGATVDLGRMGNKAVRGTVVAHKKDADSGQPLAGAAFELRTPDGKAVANAVSDEKGLVTFTGVRAGDYTVVETTPAQGYSLTSSTLSARVVTDGVSVDAGELSNTLIRGSIRVAKIDAETKKPLAGVTFGLFPAAPTNAGADAGADVLAVSTAVTDEQGLALFEGVTYGQWVVRETTPATGYNPSPEVKGRTVSVLEHGVVVEAGAAFENTPIRGSIALTKVDPAGKPLAQATFVLRDVEGREVATAKSGSDGRVLFNGVLFGKYTVTERQAPAGYVADGGVYAATITAQGEVVDLGSVVNKPAPAKAGRGSPAAKGPVIAKTGADTVPALILALMLTILAAGAYALRRRA